MLPDWEGRLRSELPRPEVALLSFTLGPVQPFIAAARTVRDLWTGSYLLSWLTLAAMRPVLEDHGAAAVVSPCLRGNPLVGWVQRRFGDVAPSAGLLTPCLPNRFTALIPAERAAETARRCEYACREEWRHIGDRARLAFLVELERHTNQHGTGWDRLWQAQVDSFFEVRTAVLRADSCTNAMMEQLFPAASSGEEIPTAWATLTEMLGRLAASLRSARELPNYHPSPDAEGRFPGKCSLLGTYEQLGPAEASESRKFWEAVQRNVTISGSRVRSTERLCAVSLVKRFAWPAYLASELRQKVTDKYYPDTATVAAACWLPEKPAINPSEYGGDWSGQWLHWSRPNQDEDEKSVPPMLWERFREKRDRQGAAPTYLAVLMMDGDRLGRMLRVLSREGQSAVSEALTGFALHVVPGVVKKHHGELIYAGGDDALVLLPTRSALSCAAELEAAYRQAHAGRSATISAGIAVVHYKEDLRQALRAAREAEKRAKSAGRDALCLRVVRRSGEDSSAVVGWEQVEGLHGLVGEFSWASDRWAYRLRAEMPTLGALPEGAFVAELRRMLGRMDAGTLEQRGRFGEQAMTLWAAYRAFREQEGRPRDGVPIDFVTLCQSASFLARGRDQR